MLDSETRRRIDTARDILVGKVPDPKSQVEQITIALIYKFMDDMDAESEELGGKRKFFAGDFARYGWAKLMRSGLGGHEILGLYAEGIQRMPENPGIPALFRDIFKNAYLPYRDPETLRAFLKVIDEFVYDHSERLGDAFEYLLSVMGSQGDAGQFRTPRHIIDFIVEIVAPKKNETILDPACGTAGFLISSYMYILKTNLDAEGNSALSPEERGRLAKQFKGYDISPDMVRLSLVNMYLHGFVEPHIFEYDTLTSTERWNEQADVILANPPFMSPKGGIRPHNRFSVQSKRSEVLFVDYMAEHLTPNGRAGIIVPEGIIFQSGTAYVQLRKMLVEEYLVAVVSLPAGVFQPYSGVKTSILFLDKSLAKKANTIGFFKVESDGFSLGAQRREIERNDLPQMLIEAQKYRKQLRAGELVTGSLLLQGIIVPKQDIGANGEYNLSGERYRIAIVGNTRFPMVPLGEVAELLRGITFRKSDQLEHSTENSLLVVTTKAAQESGIVEEDLYHIPRNLLRDDSKLLRPGDILISTANSLNLLGRTTHVRRVERPMSFGAFMSVIRPNSKILDGYLIHCLRTAYAADFFIRNANTTTNISNLNLSTLANFLIPLPSLEVQKEIMAEIEGYQRVIDGARAVVENYRPYIAIDPAWPMVELGEVCDVISGQSPESEYYNERGEGTPFYQGKTEFSDRYIGPPVKWTTQETRIAIKDDILMSVRAPVGPVNISTQRICIGRGLAAIRVSDRVLLTFVFTFLQNIEKDIRGNGGAVFDSINRKDIEAIQIPLPPLATQQAIVAEIEAEQTLVAANRELIARFEKKIQATLSRVWGEEVPTAAEAAPE